MITQLGVLMDLEGILLEWLLGPTHTRWQFMISLVGLNKQLMLIRIMSLVLVSPLVGSSLPQQV